MKKTTNWNLGTFGQLLKGGYYYWIKLEETFGLLPLLLGF